MNTKELILNTALVNPIYSLFNNDRVISLLSGRSLGKTIWRGDTESERSLHLRANNLKEAEDLIATFDLNPHIFPFKFKKAISGDGQEYKRIRTLHSSSLISLLCFYGITEQKPLRLTIEGHDILFTDSCFEEKNSIGQDEDGKPHDSNMDIVLYGTDEQSAKKVVFFLESKFSEYLSWGKHSQISSHVYKETYEKLLTIGTIERMGLRLEDTPGKTGYFDLMSNKGKTQHYAGGIKQMISHFLGVKNVADSIKYANCDIYLGEILYRFPNSIDVNQRKIDDYSTLYKILAEGLNSLTDSKFRVVSKCLTYQDVFKNYELDPSVRTFYSL